MEEREMNVMLNKAGGNSGKESLVARISIPIKWVREIGIGIDDRKVTMSFDGEKIIIKKL